MKLTLPVSKIEVELKDALSWGESEDIGAAIAKCFVNDEPDFAAFRQSKYLLLGCLVVDITDNDGSKVKFTPKWMDALTQEDGDELYNAALELRKKKSTSNTSTSNSPESGHPQA